MTQKKIGVVGPCGAGKTSLTNQLRANGYHVTHIAQEHSYVPDMWKKIARPDLLVYLDVSYENAIKRKQLDMTKKEFIDQQKRLKHASQHADLIINTDNISVDNVYEIALKYIKTNL